MNKRILKKQDTNCIKRLEKIALNKLKSRYKLFTVKNGYRKGDIIIAGLEDWKIQFQFFGDEASIIMHPYSLLDTFNESNAYISMKSIDEKLFALIDDIIKNKEYHLGCAWAGPSNSYDEGMKKYDDYLSNYNKHIREIQELKYNIKNGLNNLSKNKDVSTIDVKYLNSNIGIECFNVFIYTKNNIESELEKFYDELSNSMNIKNINMIKKTHTVKSSLLLPGRGIKYHFILREG